MDELQRAVHVDWEPYVEWWQRPYRGPSVTIDARGLRPTPGEMTADADAVRIFCFGSSTLMGLGARDDATIPAFLARRLADAGFRAAVTNYGQLGYNSTQELIALCQLLKQGKRPHIALFYDGIIEMMCAEKSGRDDTLFNESRRRAEFNLLNSDRRGDLIVAALAVAMPRTLRRLRRLTGLPLRGPLPEPAADLSQIDFAQLAAAVVAAYAANLRLVRLLAREYGFRPLFFWQPALTTKRIKSPDEQRFEGYYTSDLASRRRLYAAIVAARREHREIAGADDAIDLSGLFDEVADPVYIDPFHLSEAGNEAIAEAMLPRVAAALGAAESESARG
jgi:lysophospholipase L1-like esterase